MKIRKTAAIFWGLIIIHSCYAPIPVPAAGDQPSVAIRQPLGLDVTGTDKILLIHGWNSGSEVWKEFVDYHRKDYAGRNDVRVCDYNWRSSLPVAAKLLWEALHADEEATNWYLVCHSMGGLVVRQMINDMVSQKLSYSNKVKITIRAVVFIATPHQGTPLATFPLLFFDINKTDAIEKYGHLRYGLSCAKPKDIKFYYIVGSKDKVVSKKSASDGTKKGANVAEFPFGHCQLPRKRVVIKKVIKWLNEFMPGCECCDECDESILMEERARLLAHPTVKIVPGVKVKGRFVERKSARFKTSETAYFRVYVENYLPEVAHNIVVLLSFWDENKKEWRYYPSGEFRYKTDIGKGTWAYEIWNGFSVMTSRQKEKIAVFFDGPKLTELRFYWIK